MTLPRSLDNYFVEAIFKGALLRLMSRRRHQHDSVGKRQREIHAGGNTAIQTTDHKSLVLRSDIRWRDTSGGARERLLENF